MGHESFSWVIQHPWLTFTPTMLVGLTTRLLPKISQSKGEEHWQLRPRVELHTEFLLALAVLGGGSWVSQVDTGGVTAAAFIEIFRFCEIICFTKLQRIFQSIFELIVISTDCRIHMDSHIMASLRK